MSAAPPPALLALLGIAAAMLSLIDPLPYIRDILRGTTRPHRGSWLVWNVLAATALASQLADGASWSVARVGVTTVMIAVVLVFSVGRGAGGVGRYDLTLLAAAGLGVAAWVLSDDPAVATTLVVAVDAAAVALMLPKTWRDPWSETFSTYALASASGVLSAAAVGGLDASLLLYPVYYAAVNGCTAALIACRRRALTPAAAYAA